jgi:hypothetical protein
METVLQEGRTPRDRRGQEWKLSSRRGEHPGTDGVRNGKCPPGGENTQGQTGSGITVSDTLHCCYQPALSVNPTMGNTWDMGWQTVAWSQTCLCCIANSSYGHRSGSRWHRQTWIQIVFGLLSKTLSCFHCTIKRAGIQSDRHFSASHHLRAI